MLELQAIFQDGTVGMEFMTDDPSEAEEMRELYLTFECVVEVGILNEANCVAL
jgi:hypothetical protein